MPPYKSSYPDSYECCSVQFKQDQSNYLNQLYDAKAKGDVPAALLQKGIDQTFISPARAGYFRPGFTPAQKTDPTLVAEYHRRIQAATDPEDFDHLRTEAANSPDIHGHDRTAIMTELSVAEKEAKSGATKQRLQDRQTIRGAIAPGALGSTRFFKDKATEAENEYEAQTSGMTDPAKRAQVRDAIIKKYARPLPSITPKPAAPTADPAATLHDFAEQIRMGALRPAAKRGGAEAPSPAAAPVSHPSAPRAGLTEQMKAALPAFYTPKPTKEQVEQTVNTLMRHGVGWGG